MAGWAPLYWKVGWGNKMGAAALGYLPPFPAFILRAIRSATITQPR